MPRYSRTLTKKSASFSDTCLKFMIIFRKIVIIFLGRNTPNNKFLDVTNKETNKFMWEVVKNHLFWNWSNNLYLEWEVTSVSTVWYIETWFVCQIKELYRTSIRNNEKLDYQVITRNFKWGKLSVLLNMLKKVFFSEKYRKFSGKFFKKKKIKKLFSRAWGEFKKFFMMGIRLEWSRLVHFWLLITILKHYIIDSIEYSKSA